MTKAGCELRFVQLIPGASSSDMYRRASATVPRDPPIKAETGKRIAFAASLVAAGNVLSRLLGFIREPVIAALFGATGTADAFEVATRVPNMLFDVVVGGAISAVLVPVFSGLADDRERSARLFYTLLLIVGVLIAAVAGALIALAHPFVTLLAPAFSDETHTWL